MARILRLVTLDVNNTLFKVSGSVGRHYKDIAQVYDVDVKEEDMDKAFRHHYYVYEQKYPNFGVSVNMTPYKWWTDLVKDCFRSSGETNKEEALTQIANHLYIYFTTGACWEALPGVDTALHALKSQDFKLGVISNCDKRVDKILKNLSLRHHFDFILPSTEAGCEKPDMRIFEKALQMAEVSATEAAHVGDSIEKDYLGALNAGWNAFLVSKETNLPHVDPQHVVKNLNDFVSLLDKLDI